MPNPNAKPGAGLRLIFDLFRLAAALVVAVNVYFYCYGFLRGLGYHWEVLDAQLIKLSTTLFARSGYTKFLALLLLLPTWMGNPERKKDTPSNARLLGLFAMGTVFYFLGGSLLAGGLPVLAKALSYGSTTALGFALLIWLSYLIPGPRRFVGEGFIQNETMMEMSTR